jgi:hypothetical protein
VKFRFPEAAIGDFTLTAISRPWRLHLNFSCQVESNGWFSAIKLIARISGPGQQETLSKHSISTAERRLSHAETDLFERQTSAARVVTHCVPARDRWLSGIRREFVMHQERPARD